MSAARGKDKLPPGTDGPRPGVDTPAGATTCATSWTTSTEDTPPVTTAPGEAGGVTFRRCLKRRLASSPWGPETSPVGITPPGDKTLPSARSTKLEETTCTSLSLPSRFKSSEAAPPEASPPSSTRRAIVLQQDTMRWSALDQHCLTGNSKSSRPGNSKSSRSSPQSVTGKSQDQ